ncbi:hypothetical protein M9Y10_015505 [Tritrichomonas musculus]|uniref:Uncharacterized protein n=1 Tax=Tritrichomonas musculus TaxID=1915356 RepID=A0ABR2L2G8_9EUKA
MNTVHNRKGDEFKKGKKIKKINTTNNDKEHNFNKPHKNDNYRRGYHQLKDKDEKYFIGASENQDVSLDIDKDQGVNSYSRERDDDIPNSNNERIIYGKKQPNVEKFTVNDRIETKKYRRKERYDDNDDLSNDYKKEKDDNFTTGYKMKKHNRKRGDNDDIADNYKKRRKYPDEMNGNNINRRRKKEEKYSNKKSSPEFSTKIQLKDYTISDFFTALVSAYLNDFNSDDFFFTSKGAKFIISIINGHPILSYSPKSKKGSELMMNAISCAEKLIPFTPKSILYHNFYPNCAIEVTVNGSTHYETSVHLISTFNKNLPKIYNLNKETIEFLCTKISELSSSMNLYRIALTGEALSFSLDDNHHDIKYDKIHLSNCQSVFGTFFDDKNRLIVMISPDEHAQLNQRELDWKIENLTNDEELIQTASYLAKGLVRAYHAHDLFVIKESPEFHYLGDCLGFEKKLGMGLSSTVIQVCDYLYKEYTRGTFLRKEIPIKNMSYIEKDNDANSIENELNGLFSKVKKIKINDLKKEKDSLFRQLESVGQNGSAAKKQAIGDKLTTVKNQINEFYSLNKRIDFLKEKKAEIQKKKPNILSVKQTLLKKVESEGFKGRLIQMFGCNVFSSEQPISSEKESEKLKEILLQAERDMKIDAFCVEKIVSATVVVSHRSTSPFSPQQFVKTIETVCQKFSFIVPFCSNYIDQFSKSGGQIGVVFVEVIDAQFAVIVVSEIKQALLGQQMSVFRIPSQICSKQMLKELTNQIAIQKWLEQNGLLTIKFNGETWSGSREDVSKAYRLLQKSDTCLNLSQKVVPLSPFVIRDDVKKLQKNWIYDHLSHCLIVPQPDQQKAIELVGKLDHKKCHPTESIENTDDDDNELNGCIFVCNESIPSTLPLTVYFKDGSTKTSCLCSECFTSTLDAATNRFYSEEKGNGIDFDEVMSSTNLVGPLPIADDSLDDKGDSYWPKVPVGQLL